MNNSTIHKKVWRWRQGLRQLPLHSATREQQAMPTRELYLDVANTAEQKSVMDELLKQGIQVSAKQTHSPYDEIPAGTFIVYAQTSFDQPSKSEIENIEKLKNYITLQQGKVVDIQPKTKVGLFSRLFRLGR